MRFAPSAPLLLLLCVLCVSAAPSASSADDLEKKKADIVFRVRVQKAIRNGAKWIADQQQKNGSFKLDGNPQDGAFPQSRQRFGISALCTYTLADCGYPADEPTVKAALAYLRKHYRSYTKGDHWPQASAYSLSLVVLALHNLYVKPENRARLDEHDRYGRRKADDKNPCGYPPWARTMIQEILDWLVEGQSKEGLFRYPGGFNIGTSPPPGSGRPASHFGDEDLSNTQYVLLALWAGSRCGYDIPVEKLEAIARRLLSWQEKTGPEVERVEDPEPDAAPKAPTGDHRYAPPRPPREDPGAPRDRARGFPYTPEAPVTGSMTTAGLSSLVIVKAMLLERKALQKELHVQLDRGIWDAIAWCQANFALDRNPGMGRTWQYYYLYGLERAFVIMAKRMIGRHDWYREGATLMVGEQKDDGRWNPDGQVEQFGGGPSGGPSPFRTDVLDTCFALLFLKRATLKPDQPVLAPPAGPTTTPRGDGD